MFVNKFFPQFFTVLANFDRVGLTKCQIFTEKEKGATQKKQMARFTKRLQTELRSFQRESPVGISVEDTNDDLTR